jgi:hypothetical protein
LHWASGVRTFPQGEDLAEVPTWSSDVEVAIREAITPWPNGVEDSAVTAPFVRALELEGPTTIFDRSPELVTARSFDRAVTEDELEDSYEAALKKFV